MLKGELKTTQPKFAQQLLMATGQPNNHDLELGEEVGRRDFKIIPVSLLSLHWPS